jgi:hypothetical protein
MKTAQFPNLRLGVIGALAAIFIGPEVNLKRVLS